MIGKTVKRRLKKFVLWMEILLILVLGAGAGGVLAVWYQISKVLPPDAALDSYRPPVGSKIYSSDGQLLAKLAVENREPIPLDKIPKDMQNAMVAIEDSRFYTHGGLDFWGIGRAVVTNVSGREMSQGASTITQQLARNMFLSSRKKISRKLKEVLIAVQIERNWTKRQILEAYLNQVYFGAGAYGVKSASQTYFAKDPGKLTLAECAMLAGMPQRPSELNPYSAFDQDGNYDRTKARRDDVLGRMLTLKLIDQARYQKAIDTPIKVAKQRPATIGYFRAKYFVQYVVEQLREQMGYDQEILDKTGLTIITSLNWKMQQAAEKAMKKGINRYRGWGRVSDGALVCLDPNTGYIRAMVGGVNEPWEKHQFNCVTQARRQPGSSFKLFVYAHALEDGRSPYSSVSVNAFIRMPDGKTYAPKNHGRTRGGSLGLVPAFAGSVNGAAVNLAVEDGIFEGPKNVAALAHRMGIQSDLMGVPALALGTSEVTPLELANAYGTIAAGGKRAQPMVILQVRSQEGDLVKDFAPKVTPIGLKPTTVQGVHALTRAVVTGGTGSGAGSVADAHGKTGTTERNTDAWFAGYVPNELVTVVWAGNRNNKPMSHSLYGGTICAPIWAEFMQQAIKLNPDKKPVPMQVADAKPARRRERRVRADSVPISPDETAGNRIRLNVCGQSGLLASSDCPVTSREFLLGDQPLDRCGGNHKRKEVEKPAEGEDVKPPVDEPGKPTEPGGENL